MPDKLDSAQFSDIYTKLIELLPLLDEHRTLLKAKRGFTDDLIDLLKFRSCHPSLADPIRSLTDHFSTRELRQSGVMINDDDPNPKLTADNILIPFFEGNKVIYLKPHKSAFAGFSLKPYLPGPLKPFTILAESEFKAAACIQLGYASIGLCGVSSFSGKHFPTLLELLRSRNVTTVCVVFDTEVKDDPKLPGYKKYFWERFDVQFYAYLMALRLEQNGIEATIATLPEAWMQNGKIDIDGALAMGKRKEDFDPVIKARLNPQSYLKSFLPDIRALIQRLYQRSNAYFPVKIDFGRYVVTKQKDDAPVDTPISNFVLRIENNVYDAEGECRREVTLENNVGDKVARAVFEGEHFSHHLQFRKRCLALGNFQFTGSQKDLEAVVGLETSREIGRKVYQPDHVGWIRTGDLYLFENCGVTRTGERMPVDEEGIVWTGLTGFQAVSLQQGTEDDRGHIPRLWHEDIDPEGLFGEMEANFCGFMGIRLACSWLIATLFSHQLSQLYGSAFPLLFICGQKESGKTTLARWLSAMAGVQTEGNSYWSGSLVGFQRSLAYWSSLPFWLDEFRNSTEPSIRAKEGFLRSAYDGQMTLKGLRQNFGVRGGTIRGRVLVSGQDTPADPALQQRFVTVRMSHKNKGGENYVDLNSRAEQFSGIIPPLIRRYAQRKAQVVQSVQTMREFLRGQDLDDRTSITYAIVAGTYDGLIRSNDKAFLDFCVQHAKESFAEKEAEKPSRMFLEGIQELKARNLMNGTMVRATSDGKLAIYTKSAIGLWREQMSRRREDFPFKEATLLNEFEESEFFVDRSKNVRMGKQQVRCLILDPLKDELVRALYDAAVEEEGRVR